jgi:hypothetical protein
MSRSTRILLAVIPAIAAGAWILSLSMRSPRSPQSSLDGSSTRSTLPKPPKSEPLEAVESNPVIVPPVPADSKRVAMETVPRPVLDLFDGFSLVGWNSEEPWTVDRGEILHPSAESLTPALIAEPTILRPFGITVEIMLLGRHMEDGRSIKLVNGLHSLQLKLDNKPNEFEMLVQPGGESQRCDFKFAENIWYDLRCTIDLDGRVTATLNGGEPLHTKWMGGFPIRLELECQRSGARFRNLVVRYL